VATARVVFGRLYVAAGQAVPIIDVETAVGETVDPTVGGTTTVTSPSALGKHGALVTSDTVCLVSFGDGGTEFLLPANGSLLVAVPPGVACSINPVS
jgi:hypothetical protein